MFTPMFTELLESRVFCAAHHHRPWPTPAADPFLIETAQFATALSDAAPQTISVSQFNPSLGTLLDVKVQVNTTFIETTTISGDGVLVTDATTAGAQVTGAGVDVTAGTAKNTSFIPTDTAVTTVDSSTQSQTIIITDPAVLAQYEGTGFVSFSQSRTFSNGLSSVDISGTGNFQFDSVYEMQTGGGVVVTYDYLSN